MRRGRNASVRNKNETVSSLETTDTPPSLTSTRSRHRRRQLRPRRLLARAILPNVAPTSTPTSTRRSCRELLPQHQRLPASPRRRLLAPTRLQSRRLPPQPSPHQLRLPGPSRLHASRPRPLLPHARRSLRAAPRLLPSPKGGRECEC